ncbi:hypothetical protein PsorP6_003776 [Peronosclerospora sorghi]|uniref:Uncharacterized protein n=1 Tax=Peronosclerospora sorghi TaxID=230839 RepID=A0ACC0VR68_9STRA|nr:hypothetical protein PsorP6_003776 [Peronosclerospora sorghi]
MKRRLSDVKSDVDGDLHQIVATLVAQQVTSSLLNPLVCSNLSRFGRVAFADQEQQNVNAFLHQKLGNDSLARRPGPGGRKLTYIESCKAIELANRAFGFNGWSCHIVECKEEFKEKKGDRWSIAYSSLVRIELKDGTSHEDVGFGSSDGQRDLGAALEQAKKASVSDARKRALRLFGEYLGNSCYDREHIKDVSSNKPMASTTAAPKVEDGGNKRQLIAQNEQPRAQIEQLRKPPPPQNHHNQRVHQPREIEQPPRQHQQAQKQQEPQPMQQQLQSMQQQGQNQQHQPMAQQQQQQGKQQWKPPQVLRDPSIANRNPSVQQQNQTVPAVASRISTIQGSSMNNLGSAYSPSSSVIASRYTTSSFRPMPQARASVNAPPPPRTNVSTYAPTVVKTEKSAQSIAQYDMEDLSLSQFDYDPNAENKNLIKKMRL